MVTAFSSRRTFADDVREIDEFFAVLVSKIDPDAVALCEVTDLYRALEVVKRRAESTMLLLARKVEQAGRWKRDGHRSAAEQLAGSGFVGECGEAPVGGLQAGRQAPRHRAGVTEREVVGRESRSHRGRRGGRPGG